MLTADTPHPTEDACMTVRQLYRSLKRARADTPTNMSAKMPHFHRCTFGSAHEQKEKKLKRGSRAANVLCFEPGKSSAQDVRDMVADLARTHPDALAVLSRSMVTELVVKAEARQSDKCFKLTAFNPWRRLDRVVDDLRAVKVRGSVALREVLAERLGPLCTGAVRFYEVGDSMYFSDAELFERFPDMPNEDDWRDLFEPDVCPMEGADSGKHLVLTVMRCALSEKKMQKNFGPTNLVKTLLEKAKARSSSECADGSE